MTDLSDAIEQLEDALRDGEEVEAALSKAAEDYGLNRLLVSRKFKEKYGEPPTTWDPPPSRTDLKRKEAVIRARRLAHQICAQDLMAGTVSNGRGMYGDHVVKPGTIFLADRHEWAFVGLKGDGVLAAVIVGDESQDGWIHRLTVGSVPSWRHLSRREVLSLVESNTVCEPEAVLKA